MRQKKEGSTQSLTLDAIRAAGEITVKALQDVLGLEGDQGYARISRAARDLMLAGYIERTAPGTYRYVGTPPDIKYSGAQKRMMRLIRIRTKRAEPFTARTLAELTDVSLDWSQRFIRFQLAQGFIQKEGITRVGPSRVPTSVYLGVSEKMNEDWPVMKRQRKTASLDRQAAKVREAVFNLGREIRGNRDSLNSTADQLSALADSIRTALKTI